MQKKENRIGGRALHPEEIRDAEEAIVRRAQQDTFPEEFKALKSKKPIPPKSPLLKLSRGRKWHHSNGRKINVCRVFATGHTKPHDPTS
jgi:hypothetical protein